MSRLLAGAALAAALVISGCSNKLRTYPVSGELFIDGKPAEDAFVYFHPESGLPDGAPRPFAQVDKDGHFTISTYVSNDGAPAGEYIVTFEWRERSGLLKQNFDGPDRLKGQFYDRDKSTFHAKIEKRPNVLPRYDLQTPK